MNYNEAIQFLYQLRLFGLKFGLENTARLAEAVGRPQDKLRFIHVAGTNGKGSTCAMLEGIYRASGWRVGLFTSPHLVSFAERIQVNRQPIAREAVARLVKELKMTCDGCTTFFEAVTVMALKYFAEQNCDLVIWETGMGGRLDATNIVTPLASVITNVQLDHQQWLGETIAEIAGEKAGIVKANIPVITAAEEADALRVIVETAKKNRAPLSVITPAEAEAMGDYEIALTGQHQRMNAALATKVVEVLNARIPVSDAALRRGLKETQWAGRRQVVQRENGQTVLLDGAHNPAGARTLTDAFAGRDASLILGIMRDKDSGAVCEILAPLSRKIFLAPISSDRTADPAEIAEQCRRVNPSAQIVVCRNLAEAFERTAAESFVVVTGSLYFVGEALEWLGVVAPSTERALNEYGARPANNSSIRAVTFDIGGTLIEPWPSVGDVYSRVAERHGIRMPPEVLNQRFTSVWRDKKNFSHKKSEWKALVEQVFADIPASQQNAGFFAELFDEFADPAAWRVYDDVRPCLEQLKRSGIKLGAISNWDERLRPLLRALDLEKYFDGVIISCEAGHNKPAPEIFRAAADQLALSPRDILHIGDSRREDFEGAMAAGFQSLLLKRGAIQKEPGTIASLNELPACVAGNKLSSKDPQAILISIN